MVLAELFLEMLQRDFGYRVYKMLLSLPDKVVAPPEPEKEEAAKEEEVVKEEAAKESKDEVHSEGAAAEPDAAPVSTSAPVRTGLHVAALLSAARLAFSTALCTRPETAVCTQVQGAWPSHGAAQLVSGVSRGRGAGLVHRQHRISVNENTLE